MSARLWRLALLAAWLLATVGFLVPSTPGDGGIAVSDKLEHVGVFVAYALLIELVQPLTGRSFEMLDLGAGALGALVASLLPRRKRS